jgi:hypothetical protein
MVIKHVYHLAFRSPETSVADMFMDHIDRARPEIKSAKKLGRVRYEPDENHDNEGFGRLFIFRFFQKILEVVFLCETISSFIGPLDLLKLNLKVVGLF